MKKLISILMALSASLMITAVASAEEAPAITLEATQLTGETLDEYGAVEGKDAYLLNVNISGVDANRTSGNTVTGRVMAALELTVKTEQADLIDWENSYVYESDAAAELVQGTGAFQISSGEPTRNDSFPAKGVTVAADESNLFASVLIYIPEGESLTFEVYQLSCVFSTYASGKISDASLTKIYDIANPDSPMTCSPMTVTLGEAAPAPSAQYFYATVEAIKDNYLEFQFDEDGNGTADKGYDYAMGTMTASKDDKLTVGLKYTGTQTLELTKVIWSEIDHKANN